MSATNQTLRLISNGANQDNDHDLITDEELRSIIDATSKSKFSGNQFIPGNFEFDEDDDDFIEFNSRSPGLPRNKPLLKQRLKKLGRRISEKKMLI